MDGGTFVLVEIGCSLSRLQGKASVHWKVLNNDLLLFIRHFGSVNRIFGHDDANFHEAANTIQWLNAYKINLINRMSLLTNVICNLETS